MRKTFQIACAAMAAIAVLMLTGCKDTAALKAAVEDANKTFPAPLATIGQATALSLEENNLVCEVAPAAELSAIDRAITGKYTAIELLRNLPDLMKMAVENGMALKCNLNSEGSEPTAIEVTADELKAMSANFAAAGGQTAPILLPLYNQEFTSNMPFEICEGMTLKNVKLKEGKEMFFVEVDDKKAKFDDVRGKIVKSLENAEEKIKLAGINLSVLLPLLQELNYEVIFRYSAPGSKETFMEITAQEIKDYLAKGEAQNTEEAK